MITKMESPEQYSPELTLLEEHSDFNLKGQFKSSWGEGQPKKLLLIWEGIELVIEMFGIVPLY